MDLKTYLSNAGHGAQSSLAEAIGAFPSDVSNWLAGRRKPSISKSVAIEVATQGQVTRRDLRPDDWHLIWPELADAANAAQPAGEGAPCP